MSVHGTSLLSGCDSISLHNSTIAIGDGFEFLMESSRWAYGVSVPISISGAAHPGLAPVIVTELFVAEGCVGVGVLDDTLQRFVTTEIDVIAGAATTTVELHIESPVEHAHLMVRNTSSGGRSRFKVLSLSLRFALREQGLLRARPAPLPTTLIHGPSTVTAAFDIFISHSSRRWSAEQCDRSYLRERYARTDRLRELPPFESLPPNTGPYHGLLTVMRLELSRDGIRSSLPQHYTSHEKIVHAALVGRRLVVCCEAGIVIFGTRDDTGHVAIDPESACRVVDPWFGGLHTVVACDDRTCLLSSAAADAVLWLDVVLGRVTRRWRLPSSIYGSNYALDETTWLSEHYIPNDIQLGHVNCAAPDGSGGAFVSVLGQGDIGHVDSSGTYRILSTGHVGCHGVRYAPNDSLLYFCDSCDGTLMRVVEGRPELLFDTGSRWLHDAIHLAGDLFLMTVADRNQLLLADVKKGLALAEWHFSGSEGTVQFLAATPARAGWEVYP